MDGTQLGKREVDSICQELLLMRGAQELRRDDILIDVVLIVDGFRLPGCHKFVLAASSPYFRAMFSHGMVEQNKKEIDIMGVDRESLCLVIDYLYTSRITISDNNIQALMTTCSLLQIPGLYGKCRDYMIRRLDVSNCISVFRFARTLFCTKLEEEAFRIILRRFPEISATDDFLTLDKDDLITIISSDDLWVSKEESVYEAVLLWLSTDLERGCNLPEIFSHVRFSLIEENYLDSCILEEEMILSFPQVLSQVQAAKSYLTNLKSLALKEKDSVGVLQSSSAGQGNVDSESESDVLFRSKFPSYYVTLAGLERAIRIPLNILPRAGMNTKEYILFTNGRKTFVLNPESSAEYYGCVDGKPANEQSSEIPSSNTAGWSPNLPLMRNPEAYATRAGSVYLFGGLEVEKIPPTNILTKVYILQPDSLEWAPCSSLPIPRCMAAYGDGCGHLYVLGGKALSHGEVISTVHKYNKIENEWEEVTAMPIAIYGHGAASLHDKIYVIGGKTSTKQLLCEVHFLDCENHHWTKLNPISVPRFLHGVAANEQSNEIMIIGGSSEDGVLSSMEVYNLSDERWRFGESFPGNRCAQFAMYLKNDLHAVGGYVTERNSDGRYESREMHDIFILESTSESQQWKRKTRRIRGALACSLACVRVRLNTSRIRRARIANE